MDERCFERFLAFYEWNFVWRIFFFLFPTSEIFINYEYFISYIFVIISNFINYEYREYLFWYFSMKLFVQFSSTLNVFYLTILIYHSEKQAIL